MTLIREPTAENILLAARNLKNGALIGLPTETVYGLAADAENESAVKRIYEVKGRPFDHPLIIHIGSIEYLEKWSRDIPDYAWTLAKKFWPGPMTLILNRSTLARNFVTSDQESVAIRYPRNDVALSILDKFHQLGGNGLAAPSANRFGAVSPTDASSVVDELGLFLQNQEDFILNGGICEIGVESTIINCIGKLPTILRNGSITEKDINEIIDVNLSNYDAKNLIRHSGNSNKHYSPRAKVIISGEPQSGDGFIAEASIPTPAGCIRLSMPQNLNEFAKNLYSSFRKADKLKLSRVYVVLPPRLGLGAAIIERVRKASRE